jgi:hypothetical protein
MIRVVKGFALGLTLTCLTSASLFSSAEDVPARVQLETKKAGPRAVESLTERGILRDYRAAWDSMAHALEFNSAAPLEGPFTGEARRRLAETIAGQQRSGLSQRYTGQNHKLEAVFYAPEGDIIELHDTAEYHEQMLDGGKVIRDEQVVRHYVVLMTPSSDHWVIRQLQAVAEF